MQRKFSLPGKWYRKVIHCNTCAKSSFFLPILSAKSNVFHKGVKASSSNGFFLNAWYFYACIFNLPNTFLHPSENFTGTKRQIVFAFSEKEICNPSANKRIFITVDYFCTPLELGIF